MKYIFYAITGAVLMLLLFCLCTVDSESWVPTVGAVLCTFYLALAAKCAGCTYTGEDDEDEAR